ncbi:MAG: hypothetical protein ACOYKN_08525 [Pirellula sp.]
MMSERFFESIRCRVGFSHATKPRGSIVWGLAMTALLGHSPAANAQWKLDDAPPKTQSPQTPPPKSQSPKSQSPKTQAAKTQPSKPAAPPAQFETTQFETTQFDATQGDVLSKPKQSTQQRPNEGASMRVIKQDHQRFVQVPRATVRCGPGADYYPTGVLAKGTTVELYVETDDGWSGIRPPEGSHNWVQADAIYLMPGGRTGEVSQDNVQAWVGSDAVKNEKLLYQSELAITQTVAILGEAYRGQGTEKKLWFRIAPPQGEFRWIRSSMIATTPVAKEPDEPQQQKTSQVQRASYQEKSDSELAWSDEAEQTQRIEQQIQREQQQSKSSILEKAPKSARPATMQATGPATIASRPRPPSRVQNAVPKSDPWQLIHQRQVGPGETNSMNHILGIFGMSLVDPNNIQGHPQQGRVLQGAPQGIPHAGVPYAGVPYANAAPNPTGNSWMPQSSIASPNASSPIAGIEHLPRPTGRYSPRRYSDFSAPAVDNFVSNPSPLATENPMGVSTASFAPYGPSSAPGLAPLGPSPTAGAFAAQEEVESFQTPQIQDALVQLSVIASRPAEQWNLAPLRDSAKMWIERGETPLVRGEARLLLDRIERFESVRQRSSMTPLPPPTNYSDAVPMRSPASESEMSGWLVAVHTSLAGQPEFALTDDLGNVKAYVRPTTGLNLRRYVQQPVTVFGPQGFLPNLNAKQVVADRVVRLR